MSRDTTTRFRGRRTIGTGAVRPPPPFDPTTSPTAEYPRWRLRVFDRCWPWRATSGAAVADALATLNARRDWDEGGAIYLDACAHIQRDPPHPGDVVLHRLRKAGLL